MFHGFFNMDAVLDGSKPPRRSRSTRCGRLSASDGVMASIVPDGRLVYGMQLQVQAKSKTFVEDWEVDADASEIAAIAGRPTRPASSTWRSVTTSR